MNVKIIRHTVTTPIIEEKNYMNTIGDRVVKLLPQEKAKYEMIKRLVEKGVDYDSLVKTMSYVKKLQSYRKEYIGEKK